MGADMDAWLDEPPPDTPSNRLAARYADSKRVGVSTHNPYSSNETHPYLELSEQEWFTVTDDLEDYGRCQIREVIAFPKKMLLVDDDPADPLEYRGYGFKWTAKRTLSVRPVKFVPIPANALSQSIKDRLHSRWKELTA